MEIDVDNFVEGQTIDKRCVCVRGCACVGVWGGCVGVCVQEQPLVYLWGNIIKVGIIGSQTKEFKTIWTMFSYFVQGRFPGRKGMAPT